MPVNSVENEQPIENASLPNLFADLQKGINDLQRDITNLTNALEFSARWIKANEGEESMKEWKETVKIYLKMNMDE